VAELRAYLAKGEKYRKQKRATPKDLEQEFAPCWFHGYRLHVVCGQKPCALRVFTNCSKSFPKAIDDRKNAGSC
jgi:hypothetical protein